MRILKLLSSLVIPVMLLSCSNAADLDPKTVEDLNGLKVGVIGGSLDDIDLAQNHPEVERHIYNNPSQLFRALQTRRVDAILNDSVSLFEASPESMGMRMTFWGYIPGDAAFGMNLRNTALCDSYNAFFAEIKQSGLYGEIIDRWTSGTTAGVRMPDIPKYTEGEPLTVGILTGDAPFGFIGADGYMGLEPELLYRFAAYLKRPIRFEDHELSSMIAGIQTGKLDIMSSFLFITEERQKSILFTQPYYSSSVVCIVNDSSLSSKTGLWQGIKENIYDNLLKEDRYRIVLEGLYATLLITLLSLILGTMLGALLCWRTFCGPKRLWKGIMKVYGAIMHGVPLLVLLMIMFYLVFASTTLNGVAVSVITFTVFFAYSSCEMFRSGIENVDSGQMEAAVSIGFSRAKGFRYVVLPQALKNIVPFFESETVTLLKETSIVGFIAVVDLTKASDIIQSRTFDAFFPLIITSLIYFLFAWALTRIIERLFLPRGERRSA